MHYLLSTLYVYSILLDAVSDYHVTPPVKLDSHSTGAVAIARTDDFLRFVFVAARWALKATSFSSCFQECSRAWHPCGLSPVWLYVLRTCVCIAVFDFPAYDRQLKTKLHFRGRVNNNACAQSCTTLCQLHMSTLYIVWCGFRLSWYTTRETRQHSTRAVVIAHTDDFLRVFLSQRVVPSRQPASAAACRRVLEPDILEVSHLCGCMYWESVCACLCLTSERMMFSLKQNYILE